MERVVAQEPLGVGDRARLLAVGLEAEGEPLQHPEVARLEPLARSHEPLVVAPFEQVARVHPRGLLQRLQIVRIKLGSSQGRLEGGDVAPEGGLGAPAERLRRDLEERSDIRQGALQLMEQVAEVGARLAFGQVGPEQKGKLLSGLGRRTVKQQVSEQRLGTRGH